jgi:hypothetical protein
MYCAPRQPRCWCVVQRPVFKLPPPIALNLGHRSSSDLYVCAEWHGEPRKRKAAADESDDAQTPQQRKRVVVGGSPDE